jgi:hypothetical protein
VTVTYGDYAERIDAMTFYDLYDIKEAELERQNRELKKQKRSGRATG